MRGLDVIAIVGPTAVGKSIIAHLLARYLKEEGIHSEIISCDSMQVYRYFDIGTNKIEPEYRREFNYHLIDILEPNEGRFSAGEFRKRFDEIVGSLKKESKLGILVGGTGLYYKAVKVGMFEGPSADHRIREELYRISKEKGVEYLYNILKDVDSEYSSKISKNDLKRIVRALEVFKITGVKFSELHRRLTSPSPYRILSFFLLPDRKALYEKINERVDRMLSKGLVEEVRWIISKYGEDIYPLSSIGYKEVVSFLKGMISYEDMVNLIKRNTREFARKQIILFRNTIIDKTISLDLDYEPKYYARLILDEVFSAIRGS